MAKWKGWAKWKVHIKLKLATPSPDALTCRKERVFLEPLKIHCKARMYLLFITALHISIIQRYFNKSVMLWYDFSIYGFFIHFILVGQSGKLIWGKVKTFPLCPRTWFWLVMRRYWRWWKIALIANPIREIMVWCSVLTFAGHIFHVSILPGKKCNVLKTGSQIKTVLCWRFFFQIPKNVSFLK